MTIIGIDLGTSNTCAAFYDGTRPEMIFTDNDSIRVSPSYVSYTNGDWLVGTLAKQMAPDHLKNTVFEAKRMIGRSFSHIQALKSRQFWPFTVENEKDVPVVNLCGERFSIELIQSKLLEYVRTSAKSQLRETVTQVVISVPAYFNTEQRDATKRAAKLAGLTVRQLIHEPTAAAIAYAWKEKPKNERIVLVFDLGGGTFDVSILKIKGQSYEILAVNGDSELGGRDFDENLMRHVLNVSNLKDVDDENNKALFQLRQNCELTKRTLSKNDKAKLVVGSLLDRKSPIRELNGTEFEAVNLSLFQRTVEIMKQAILDAGLNKSQIEEVLMVGGSSHIPKLNQLLRDHFGRDILNKSLNPDEVVAQGAAILARTLDHNVPSELRGLQLFEVTPLTLSIEVLGGIVSCIIPRNSRIPVEECSKFFSTRDGQTEINFKLFEGERVRSSDNNLLGKFVLCGVRSANRGEVAVQVISALDESGCLNVTAVEVDGTAKNQITIKRNKDTKGEGRVDRSVYCAEGHAEEDRKHKARYDRWYTAYDSIFEMKRKVERTTSSERKQKYLDKCDDISRWFRDNELADDHEWSPKIKELQEFIRL